MFKKIKTFFGTPQRRSVFRKLFVAPLALVLLSGSCFIALGAAVKTVEINDEGKIYTVTTTQSEPREILIRAGIETGSDDRITVSDGGRLITVKRAFPVTVSEDGIMSKVTAVRGETVGDVLRRAGIADSPGKAVTPSAVTGVTRATVITVNTPLAVQSNEPARGAESDVDVRPADTGNESAHGNGSREDQTTVKQPQQSEPEKSASDTRPSPGKTVAGKSVISTLTPEIPIELDGGGRPLHYKRLITGQATAYCTGTTCSTGVKVQPGYIGVDPQKIPYGTKMYIVSHDGKFNYGYAVAADTGPAARSGRIIADLYMSTRGECLNFGRRDIDIYILA